MMQYLTGLTTNLKPMIPAIYSTKGGDTQSTLQPCQLDTFTRQNHCKPNVRFGTAIEITPAEIQNDNQNLKQIIGQLETALTAGPIQKIPVPQMDKFLQSKGLSTWPPDASPKILNALQVIQVGSDPDNQYVILRPAGKPSPIFSVYGLKDNLRLTTGIRSSSISDTMNVYYDVNGANTPQVDGVDAQGHWKPPVSYSSIDATIFDEAQRVQRILEQNQI